jgi:hypothetical protein
MMTFKRTRRDARGVALILALLILTVFASLSVAFFSSTSMNLVQSSNLEAATRARLAAESGLSFLIYEMLHCGISGSLRGQALLDSLAARLSADLNGTANLGGSVVAYDGSTITVPTIGFGVGKSFVGRVTLEAADTLRLTVTGQYTAGTGASIKTVQRELAIDLHPAWDQAIAFGICSKGPVEMGMNTDLSGVTQASDGSIYSGAIGTLASPAVSCGSGHISGDVSVSPPNTAASLDLAGTTVDGTIRYDAPPVTMPTIDRTPYKSLATTVMNSPTPAGGTYKNIRIPANTNPTFNNSVTIQGVMYVEAPNTIYFNNNVTFTGVIVADKPPAGSPDSANYIYFKNNMTFNGVELLVGDEFSEVRKLQGATILCPDFTMEFKNNANLQYVGGIMALKSLIAKNNLDLTIMGSVLIYGDAGLDFKNNSDLDIRLSGSSPPPGFIGYGLPPLAVDPDSYVEK